MFQTSNIMRQHVLKYTIGGPTSANDMANNLNEWIDKGWIIKSVTNVYNGYNIVVLEENPENVKKE